MIACARCGRESPDEFGFCPGCGAPLAATALVREVRKVVTVLFCDLTGSTAIGERTDPEALRTLMNRYYETARGVLERHGGTVEKFVGDAVMAVFGTPVTREDDALRATRAAVELREVVQGIGLDARIGVNTGPVVAGEGDTLVTGDAVNVAARLEQAAGAGEILLGETTLRLVRDAVEVAPIDLDVKGKSAPVRAHKLVELDREARGVTRHLQRTLVGRERERDRLKADFDEVAERRTCRLFTLIGPAGVGKSRLVHDFLDRVGDAATVARGRALSYGEGITYWPLVEILLQLGVDPDEVVRSSPADTQLVTRALLERLAEERPLVLVLDDLHWAEPPMIDLVEHLVDWSRERPIFLVCIARPELLDIRPGWGGGKLTATSVLLDPLPDRDAAALASALLEGVEIDPETRGRILSTAEGNPLFLEEMALLARGAEGAVDVPPTIQALLQARLDTLEDDERAVVDRGAVEGKVFHRGAVTALAPEANRAGVPSGLLSLVRKEVVRPDQTQIPGDEAFRFRHLLIRDTAYESLPKTVRAELHERCADWLDVHARLYEQDEIVGYHLEQAARCRSELDADDPRAAELGARAGAHLGTAARAAFEREDLHATRSLVERAIELSSAGRDRTRLMPYLLHALLESGDPLLGSRLDELEQGSELDRAVATVFRVASSPNFADPHRDHARLDEAQRVLEATGEDMSMVFCEMARAHVYWASCQAGSAHGAYRRAYERLRRAKSQSLGRWLGYVMLWIAWNEGRTTAEFHQLLDELERDSPEAGPRQMASLRSWRARATYLEGAIDAQALREHVESEAELLVQAGSLIHSIVARLILRDLVPLVEGDAATREQGLREALEDTAPWSELFGAHRLGEWALSLCELGQTQRAKDALEQAGSQTKEGDLSDEILLLSAEAWVRALEGERDRPRELLREAYEAAEGIDVSSSTDRLDRVAAHVQLQLGDLEEARVTLTALVERLDARGWRRLADRFRRDLAALDD